MPPSDSDRETARREQELRIQRQIAFASGIFQENITIRTLLESLAEGVVIIDNSGTILLVNTRAEEMFGYPKKELIGKPHAVLVPERFRKVHEEHEAHFFAEPRIRPMGQLLDLAGRRRDGSEFPLEISLGFIETINGVLVMALVSDMTMRKQFESRLRESEELFHIQVERVQDYAIYMLDAEGKVLNWNAGAERLMGYRDEEIIGKHFSCFYSEEERDAGKPEEVLKKASVGVQIADEGWRVRKDESRFWADVIITTLHDESGTLRGFSNVTRDMTERKKVEDALRFSEARYRALHRDNPTMIFTLDAEGTILSANPTSAIQLGYTPDELEGQPVLKVFHEDDRPAVVEQLRRCVQNPDQVHRWQFRKIRKDGGLLWVEEIAQAVHDLNGALNVLVVCQDITERKQAEEALLESEEKFSKIFDMTPVGITISTLADGRFVEINREGERLSGYRRDEVIGRTALEFDIWKDSVERDRMIEEVRKEGVVRDREMTFRDKEGNVLRGLFSAVVIDIGGKKHLLSLVSDITERKRAEEALRKSELKLSKIFHSVPALIGITTVAEGRCIDINDAGLRTLGYRREEMVGRTMLELGVWENKAARDRVIKLLEEEGTVRDLEINFRGKNGKTFTGLMSADTIDFNGDRYMLSIVSDITERKRMQEEIERLNTDLSARAVELEAANQELEAFNYTVAHDLRKPLTVINSYTQVIKELCGNKLDEKCADYLEEAYNGTLRMNQLIDALLNFSRLAHVEPHRETVDLSAMAQEVAAELELAEPERRVEFLIADGVSADGDAALLRVVLANLIGNAWKYTGKRDEGIIEFGTTEVDGKPAYIVRDNGAGFAMADAEKLFVPFQRLPGAEECRGFGIGLATVERIIRRHGGRVWAGGEPGKGATFYFTL